MARVAFLQDIYVEYMGFMCMSAVLKQAGHTVEVFIDDRTNPEKFVKEVADYRPDVIGFSLLTPSAPWALALCPHLKEFTTAVTVLGNVHAILSPECIEAPGVDLVCIGEGEGCMLDLCHALDHGESYEDIPGFAVKTHSGIKTNPMRSEMVDMNTAPFLDRSLYNKYFYFRKSPYLRVMMGRGCPFRCTFCSNPLMLDHFGGGKKFIRKRTPELAIEEIEHLVRVHPMRVTHILFTDEVFWVKNDWLRTFLKLYKERINIPFRANYRFGAVAEEDIEMLAAAGCEGLLFAVETASEETRRGLLNKPVTNEHILQVAGWLHKYGIKFAASAFFGLPGHSVEDHRKQLSFYRALNPMELWTTFFQPYPGLSLTKHPDIQAHMPDAANFGRNMVYQEMYLDLPDRDRLINMKKIYWYMMRYPYLERPLLWLTNYNIPIFFDFMFLAHYAWMVVFWWDKISWYQWLIHFKQMLINPLIVRKHPWMGTGKQFTPRRSNLLENRPSMVNDEA